MVGSMREPTTTATAGVRCRAVEGYPSVWYDPPHNG
jgi:hypothetical protein